MPFPKIILIGGSSHAGKSTLAAALSKELGCRSLSTDRLARHPGRPWNHNGPLKIHVAQHYTELSVEELIGDVLRHYRINVLPQVADLMARHISQPGDEALVLEGSALWPTEVAKFDLNGIGALWLSLPDDVFEWRIKEESRYAEARDEGRFLIDKFLQRTLAYNRQMNAEIVRLGLKSLAVERTSTVDDLVARVLAMFGKD